MAEIDEIREFIGYLKVILGLTLATIVGLISWLVKNYNSGEKVLLYADILLIFVLIAILLLVNKKILIDIKRLKDL